MAERIIHTMARLAPPEPELLERRQKFLDRVDALIQELAGWAEQRGWKTTRTHRAVEDAMVGSYVAPELVIWLANGEVHVKPISAQLHRLPELFHPGAGGRVDLEGIPTLHRVKLIAQPSGWRIMTDSGVPLRIDWTRESFAQLVEDLLA